MTWRDGRTVHGRTDVNVESYRWVRASPFESYRSIVIKDVYVNGWYIVDKANNLVNIEPWKISRPPPMSNYLQHHSPIFDDFFSSPPAVRKWITPLGSEICYAHLDVKIRNRGHTCNFQLVMHQLPNIHELNRKDRDGQMDSLSPTKGTRAMIHFKIFLSWSPAHHFNRQMPLTAHLIHRITICVNT